MGIYTKFIVSAIMMFALLLKTFFQIDWSVDEATLTTWIDTGIAIFTPLLVWLLPNKKT